MVHAMDGYDLFLLTSIFSSVRSSFALIESVITVSFWSHFTQASSGSSLGDLFRFLTVHPNKKTVIARALMVIADRTQSLINSRTAAHQPYSNYRQGVEQTRAKHSAQAIITWQAEWYRSKILNFHWWNLCKRDWNMNRASMNSESHFSRPSFLNGSFYYLFQKPTVLWIARLSRY